MVTRKVVVPIFVNNSVVEIHFLLNIERCTDVAAELIVCTTEIIPEANYAEIRSLMTVYLSSISIS